MSWTKTKFQRSCFEQGRFFPLGYLLFPDGLFRKSTAGRNFPVNDGQSARPGANGDAKHISR